jgi:iron complex transport system substrate-binding protein
MRERMWVLGRAVVAGALVMAVATALAPPVAAEVSARRTAPKRVVALGEEALLADLLDLSVPVVASTANIADEGFIGIDADTKGIEVLESSTDEIEHVATLEPDLVVTTDFFAELIGADRLEALGDVAIIDTTGDWRADYLETAKAVGATKQAKKKLRAYERTFERARDTLAADGRSVSLAAVYPGDAVAIWTGPGTLFSDTLLDLGFDLVPSDAGAEPDTLGRVYVSAERLDLLEGDDLVLLHSPQVEGETESLRGIRASELWQQIPAVKADRVVEVDRLAYNGLPGRRALVELYADELAGSKAANLTSSFAPDDFPVEIEHKYGTTTIESAPERIVTVGLTDQDAVLALGERPVGISGWINDTGVMPWNKKLFGKEKPATVDIENIESIAALEPDLILGVASGMTQQQYDTLSQLAPTIAQSAEYPDYLGPWEGSIEVIGKALGKEQQAQKVLARVKRQLAAAADAHPEFAGKTAEVAYEYEGTVGVYTGGDVRSQLLTELGFELPPAIAGLPNNGFYAEISKEQANLLEADAAVWCQLEEETFVESDVYQATKNSTEGRDVLLDCYAPTGAAMSFGSVLSIPFALKRVVPALVAAVDGNPKTEVPNVDR